MLDGAALVLRSVINDLGWIHNNLFDHHLIAQFLFLILLSYPCSIERLTGLFSNHEAADPITLNLITPIFLLIFAHLQCAVDLCQYTKYANINAA
jgi:hypothetical protein